MARPKKEQQTVNPQGNCNAVVSDNGLTAEIDGKKFYHFPDLEGWKPMPESKEIIREFEAALTLMGEQYERAMKCRTLAKNIIDREDGATYDKYNKAECPPEVAATLEEMIRAVVRSQTEIRNTLHCALARFDSVTQIPTEGKFTINWNL